MKWKASRIGPGITRSVNSVPGGFEGDGSAGVGTVEFDAEENEWEMEGTSKNMINGQKYIFEGTMEFVDADTVKWDFEAWDSLHLTKYMEMHGTNRRQ